MAPSKSTGFRRSTVTILVLGLLLTVQIRLQASTGRSFVSFLLLDAAQEPSEEVIVNSTQGNPGFVDARTSTGTGNTEDRPDAELSHQIPASADTISTPDQETLKDDSSNTFTSTEQEASVTEKLAFSIDGDTKKDANAEPKRPKKPLNVIVLYPDDWRHDDIGGVAPVVRTPFLNQLAQQGIRFTHNAVTTSICWISRATLFTGQYASRHKSLRIRQPLFYKEWDKTWPSLLQKAGYYVGHVGKWQYQNRGGIVQSLFNWTSLFEGQHWYKGEPAANYTRDETIRFLKERPKDRPFAATIAFYPPKAVTLNPTPGAQFKPSKNHYENVTIPVLPYNWSESHNRLPWFFQTDERFGKHRFSTRWQTAEQYQLGMQHYYSLITEVDQACREIVEFLKEENILEDTLVIFTTDNGLFHGAHGLAGKWYPYSESIRIPLIIRDPRMPPSSTGTLNDDLTLNVDLAPTILGAAGIPKPESMQGRDMSDLYLTEDERSSSAPSSSAPWRNEFYYEFPLDNGKAMPTSSAVVRHDIKFINWWHYNYTELFNLTADPLEQHDVSNETSYASIYLELQARHAQLQQSVL